MSYDNAIALVLAVLVAAYLIDALVLLLFSLSRERLARLAPAFIVALLCLLPWLLWRRHLPSLSEDYPSRLRPALLLQNAQRLVDMIVTSVEPSQWNVNGGPGSVTSTRAPSVT